MFTPAKNHIKKYHYLCNTLTHNNMKILKGISMFSLTAVLLVGCKQTSNSQEEVTPENINAEQASSNEISGTIQKATFQVEGMACAVGCAKVIEKKLAHMDGVKLRLLILNLKQLRSNLTMPDKLLKPSQKPLKKLPMALIRLKT